MEEDNVCRLCRRESEHLESLQSYREGLPISVLIMVICPIKITRSEPGNMPKFICGDCLEVILSAYKLREESIQSDRYFRECLESSSMDDEEPMLNIKQEPESCFADFLPIVVSESSRKNQDLTPSRSKRTYLPVQRNQATFPYKVDCHRKGLHKSLAWDYFGRLVYLNGDVVEDEASSLFCRLCIEENKAIKRRYKAEPISTGMIFTHLKNTHGIERDGVGGDEMKPNLIKTSPAPLGLTFHCTMEDCEKVFKIKICLEIHLQLEHTGIADELPTNMEYRVNKSQAGPSKSMAWTYFGSLLNLDMEIIDDQHNYCRLCANGGMLTKYVKSTSTTTLLHHIHEHHLKEKTKRKRFGGSLPSISSAKIAKGVDNLM